MLYHCIYLVMISMVYLFTIYAINNKLNDYIVGMAILLFQWPLTYVPQREIPSTQC